jgi:hypothetical protein
MQRWRGSQLLWPMREGIGDVRWRPSLFARRDSSLCFLQTGYRCRTFLETVLGRLMSNSISLSVFKEPSIVLSLRDCLGNGGFKWIEED